MCFIVPKRKIYDDEHAEFLIISDSVLPAQELMSLAGCTLEEIFKMVISNS